MSYKIDMINIGNFKPGDNFGSKVLQLVMKADLHNLALLRGSFPNAVKTVENWRQALDSEDIDDLPYD
jgi:hypothetical protein